MSNPWLIEDTDVIEYLLMTYWLSKQLLDLMTSKIEKDQQILATVFDNATNDDDVLLKL